MSANAPSADKSKAPTSQEEATHGALRTRLDRIFNDPDQVVEDGVRGVLLAYPDLIAATSNPRVLKRARPATRRKVGIVTGGGSGHEPAFLGYVGPGMLDAVAVGEIFSSPTALSFLDAMREADNGAGVACLFGNYAGDTMNVRMAVRDAQNAGISVKTVVATDDVASAPVSEADRRRGVAGEILMWKIAGARAEEGASLDEVIAVAEKVIRHTRSIGVGLTPCTIVANGHPNFSITLGTMEVGIGHHGEPGVSVQKLGSAREIAQLMIDHLLPDLPFAKGDRVTVLLSGLGATPVIELYTLYADIADILAEKGIVIAHRFVGNYFTSLEMKGVTLTLMKMDEELERLVKAPAESIGLTQNGPATSEGDAASAAVEAPVATLMPDHQSAAAARKTARYLPETGIDLAATTGIVPALVTAVTNAREWLSEIDGKIGDGDHGINMAKGFARCGDRLGATPPPMGEGLAILSDSLMAGIGGSMGPLYGRFFEGMAQCLEGAHFLDAKLFGQMLRAALAGINSLGNARVGDKTLIDTLQPAVERFDTALQQGQDFIHALDAMSEAAEKGRDSTIDLVARIGRASRLGERSRGVLDAGATSCCLILQTMATSLKPLII
ncbi:dihydroxyacetone kinase subunit DhaL [Candidatus Kirkpatrickella diaphorinae]|uniref:Dihydroxyacetone kinase subunit DhaL n=1 Tax=Candidatus Kirkpatrickella diaphorinae TaxID=2984322 RepID=A0ABY6GGR5_9PROT|nr:dihydroxyacetone kinase subunit DhaL [Candidatus Kirkpatrickella diaphorinae]UYH50705.1 dihydroxyacetone kinase subunit DhaL [Candidatus Kirkpatrickella diaphorinae]